MRHQWLAITMLVGLQLGESTAVDAANDFFVSPVTTDVQRRFVTQATVYAVVDGNAFLQATQAEEFQKLLDSFEASLQDASKTDNSNLRISVRYQGFDRNREAESRLKEQLSELANKVGFKKARVTSTWTSQSWEDFTARISDEPDGDELFINNEKIRAFSIQSNLSRLVAGDADCVVEIRRPFDGRQASLPADLRDAIRTAVDALNIKSRNKILFHLSTTEAGVPVMEELFHYRDNSEGTAFIRELGFKTMRYRHSPNGGAPEKLIGKPAPNFKLPMLNGETFTLSEQIKGKVAIVTFWGVACGPCCVEAPHLSAVYEQFKGQGFVAVGVNGYDETEDVVAQFVETAKLTHPIVLQGGDVAKQYRVGAYPTTYWVDHQGNVIDYVVGFDEGDEKEIAQRVKALVGRIE